MAPDPGKPPEPQKMRSLTLKIKNILNDMLTNLFTFQHIGIGCTCTCYLSSQHALTHTKAPTHVQCNTHTHTHNHTHKCIVCVIVPLLCTYIFPLQWKRISYLVIGFATNKVWLASQENGSMGQNPQMHIESKVHGTHAIKH